MADNPFESSGSDHNPFDETEDDANPFGDDSDNPFDNDVVTTSASAFGEPTTSSSKPTSTSTTKKENNPFAKAKSSGSRTKRQLAVEAEELKRREEDLKLRERAIAAREAALPGDRTPNWPKCKPLVFHSIAEDIPAGSQRMVRMTYYGWYLLALAYVFNWVTLMVVLIDEFDGAGNTSLSFGLATLMMVIGIPISFAGWYRPLYHGARSGKSSLFLWFFFTFGIHILLCLFWALGIPSTGSGGFIIGLKAFSKDASTSGTFCLIGTFVWMTNVVYGVIRIYKAHQVYLGRGLSSSSAKREVAATAAAASV